MISRYVHALVIMILTLGFVPPRLRIPAFILLGLFAGMGLLLAHIGRTTTYLIDSPDTCMNCHVMTDVYVSHAHSSHGRDVSCNDCHLPHTSIVREYIFKAQDGLRHACAFALRLEPQSMHLSSGAIPVAQENCLRCHEDRMSEVSAAHYQKGDQRCWDCHQDVVHGRVHSLSASPDVTRPCLPPVTDLPPIPSIQSILHLQPKDVVPPVQIDVSEDEAE